MLARPLAVERHPSLIRRSRRGRRSLTSLAQRRDNWQATGARDPHYHGACKTAPQIELECESFTFSFLNIRGFTTHEAELHALTEELGSPTFVGLAETFLSPATKELNVPGYCVVSRRDRPDNSGWGGIALLVHNTYYNCIVHIGNSTCSERSWHLFHTGRGTVALCLWYRPPAASEIASIESLSRELAHFGAGSIGTLIIGDMNVHNVQWLKHSSGTSVEGRALHAWCCEQGFTERVGKPTRGPYLLDLVLTDLGSKVKASVVVGLSDHHAISGRLLFQKPHVTTTEREVFLYKKAQWGKLKLALQEVNWDKVFVGCAAAATNTNGPDGGCEDNTTNKSGCADAAAQNFTDAVMRLLVQCIPKIKIQEQNNCEHPWLTDTCKEAISRKRAAFGQPEFVQKRDDCSQILNEAYQTFVQKTRLELLSLKKGSKQWWKQARQLMRSAVPQANMPTLKRDDGSWATSPTDKANLLSETFAAKSVLDAAETNLFSAVEFGGARMTDGFLPVRTRNVLAVLRDLDINSGTGPDQLSARVLRECAKELARPIAILCRILLSKSRWPVCWRLHWIHALHKRGSKADPRHYRGIHLTCQISKVVERVLGQTFLRWAVDNTLFGPNQYAYTTARSHKDALAVNTCSWLLSLEKGQLVALYCSDVSGAFDRVRATRLQVKLQRSGLHRQVVALLESWLEERECTTLVGGNCSDRQILRNSVYQGTVWGPPLWNIHLSDARVAVQSVGFEEVIFADDLFCFCLYITS